jgi:1-acyl-sn-glycerol-3-phosphate acyltransferase
MGSREPNADDTPDADSGAARSQGTSPFANSISATDSEDVPSTELDPRRSDFPDPGSAAVIVDEPTQESQHDERATTMGRFAATGFDQETTLQSTNEETAALRAALDAHLVKVAAARAVGRLPGEDVDDDASDVAPVGPTEFAQSPPSVAAPSPAPQAPTVTRAELEDRIRELEARLDAMIGGDSSPTSPGPRVASAHTAPVTEGVYASDFVKQRWGPAALRTRAEEVDEFGHDPAFEARCLRAIDFLYDSYFRVETRGAELIPKRGRCLVVANHSGGPLPYDGLMLRAALRREHEKATALLSNRDSEAPSPELRWLAEDFIYYLPFVGAMMNRLGAVRACQENAERLLAKGRLVAVFPEGAKGIGKLYKERYRLQRFGRGGFIRLALRTRTKLVPAAIVGAEEANPLFYRVEGLAKSLGVPYLPITPTFPALGPLGLLPAPTKWKIVFGEAISFDTHGPDAAEDDLLVGRLAEQVRATIQRMVDVTVSGRRSVWFG